MSTTESTILSLINSTPGLLVPVFLHMAPPKSDPPYVTFKLPGYPLDYHMSGELRSQEVQVQVHIHHTTANNCANLRNKLRSHLSGYSAPGVQGVFFSTLQGSEIEADSNRWKCVLNFSAVLD